MFERQVKRRIKKHASLKNELEQLAQKLAEEPQSGIPLGNNWFKIRISISSKGKGKSGGGRIITHFAIRESVVYLLSIYDKSEKEDLTNKELTEQLECIPD
ncbi:MAG: type II toxin-antitoxin system RelE/ParE family toxin [Tannerella sp.]|nr:type II toxin-antitoxin system RelE/ParE family toxin [Tannerella sp.]